ncbi:DUF4192 domain-containing protein [Nonomuraea polychroma]|uniref:DUF4192 domain-containing protein n=1 Tax=Nonomuraea polychroma TaxID=46176 RepID=UPI003D944211
MPLFHVTASTPGEYLAVLPHIISYHPHEQLVIVYEHRHHTQSCLLLQLPLDDEHAALAHVRAATARDDFDSCHLVGYGPRTLVDPAFHAVVPALAAHLQPAGIYRVHDGRYHTYTADGAEHDTAGQPLPEAPPAVAAAVAHGWAPARSRQDLLSQFAPTTGRERHISDYMGLIAALELSASIPPDPADRYRPMPAAAVTVTRAELATTLDTWQQTGQLDDKHVTRLALAVHITQVRDEVIGRLAAAFVADDYHHISVERSMWLTVMRRVHLTLITPPANLYALAAWMMGDYVHASEALNHALRCDPSSTMAKLVMNLVDSTASPDPIVPPMASSPEETRAAQGKATPSWVEPFEIAIERMLDTFSWEDLVAAGRLVPTCEAQTELEPPITTAEPADNGCHGPRHG